MRTSFYLFIYLCHGTYAFWPFATVMRVVFFLKKELFWTFTAALVPIMLTTCSARLQSVRRRAASLQLDVTRRNPKSVSNFKMNIFGVAVFRLGFVSRKRGTDRKASCQPGRRFLFSFISFPPRVQALVTQSSKIKSLAYPLESCFVLLCGVGASQSGFSATFKAAVIKLK